jgi:rare lipoprotein A
MINEFDGTDGPSFRTTLGIFVLMVILAFVAYASFNLGRSGGMRLVMEKLQPSIDRAAEKIVELDKEIRKLQDMKAEYERLLTESGKASWYGEECAENPTANGETFDPEGMTAASWTWPFGTMLRVTSMETRRSVNVRVNDRGPARRIWRRGVIIDLSRRAAEELGMIQAGRHPVVVTPILGRPSEGDQP